MTIRDFKERAVQAASLLPVALLAAALTCPATDIEPPWDERPSGDAGSAGKDEAGGSADAVDPGPPRQAALACAGGETAAGGCCVTAGIRSAAIRFAADRATTGSVRCGDGESEIRVEAPQPAAQHRIVVGGLASAAAHECTVAVGEAEGETVLATIPVETGPDGPWVVVTEVMLNPLGPEPAQEFVEIANLSGEDVALGGWRLLDEGDAGLTIPAGVVLPARAVAILAPDGYDPGGAGDPAADPAALIVRLGRTLGTQGLRNSGESVSLVDADGNVVSIYPNNLGALADGVSAVRAPAVSPDGDPFAWVRGARGAATPGRL